MIANSATETWHRLIADILATGKEVSPRGLRTIEMLHNTTIVNMNYPVVTDLTRKVSYVFMAGEAYWILNADDSTAGIVPYNKFIAQFSDDGHIFNGAYGPPIQRQMRFVVNALQNDPDTRQAVLTIWRENGVCGECRANFEDHNNDSHKFKITKDVPCTVMMAFNLRNTNRNGKKVRIINTHVFMRSSDAWLGWVYDVFNFTCVTMKVASFLKPVPELGHLYLTMMSSHLYQDKWDVAKKVLTERSALPSVRVPRSAIVDYDALLTSLVACRDRKDEENAVWRIRPVSNP